MSVLNVSFLGSEILAKEIGKSAEINTEMSDDPAKNEDDNKETEVKSPEDNQE